MKWYKRLHRNVKEFWDVNLRPIVEPVLIMVIKSKAEKEIERATR